MQNHVNAHAVIPMISAARWEESVTVVRWGSGSDTAFVDCGVVVVTVVDVDTVSVDVVVFVVVVFVVVVGVVLVIVVVVESHCEISVRHEEFAVNVWSNT